MFSSEYTPGACRLKLPIVHMTVITQLGARFAILLDVIDLRNLNYPNLVTTVDLI